METQKKGTQQDIDNCEDHGFMKEAASAKVPNHAMERGLNQLATLGSGNHFIEIQKVDKIYQQNIGIEENQITLMIHTGSRGFGHEIADNYMKQAQKSGVKTPTKNLASFKINSQEGQNYQKAMAAAANFAFANRHLITHKLRQIWEKIFSGTNISLYYDLTHNIAKKEKISGRQLLIHRKGAAHLAEDGLALIPGSMGTHSYLVKSANSEATRLSYNSVAHGAGRKMGRRQAKREISENNHQQSLGKVKVYKGGKGSILDESPLAYKNIEDIIDSLITSDLAQPLARFQPLAVLKG